MRCLYPYLLTTGIALALSPVPLWAQQGAALFTDNCAPCHSIGGGDGVGPDLRGVTARKDHAWLLKFILDPEATTHSGDAYAKQLEAKYGMVMPAPTGLTAEDVARILDYIDGRSGGVAPPAAAPPASPAFTADDLSRGQALYLGRTRLANGGPSCLSCHDAGGGRAPGGTLAPNLAQAVTRLNGATATAAWLSSPPTPVMRAVFRRTPLTRDEITAVTAFLDDRARQPASPRAAATRRFLTVGVAGAAVAFLVLGVVWRTRLRPVRRALLAGAAVRPPAIHTQGFRSGGPR